MGRSTIAALLGVTLVLTVVLAACTRELDTPGERLRILGGGLPPAFVGVPYDAPIATAGGLRPFRYEVASGQLPDGLELVAGVIGGVPTAAGTSTFTVEVSDGNLASTVREFRLVVEEVPPPELQLDVPPTEIRGPATVRVLVDGRDVQGLRSVLSWDPDVLRLVPGSVRSESPSIAVLFDPRTDELQLDVALLGAPRSGTIALARFELEPVAAPGGDGEPATADVFLRASTEYRAARDHAFDEASFGTQPDGDDNASDGAGAGDAPSDGAALRTVGGAL